MLNVFSRLLFFSVKIIGFISVSFVFTANASILDNLQDFDKSLISNDATIQSVENGFVVENSYFTTPKANVKCFFKKYTNVYDKKTLVYNSKATGLECVDSVTKNKIGNINFIKITSSKDILFGAEIQLSEVYSEAEKTIELANIKKQIKEFIPLTENGKQQKENIDILFSSIAEKITSSPNFSKSFRYDFNVSFVIKTNGSVSLFFYVYENKKEFGYFRTELHIDNMNDIIRKFKTMNDVEKFFNSLFEYLDSNVNSFSLGKIEARFNYGYDFTPYHIKIMDLLLLTNFIQNITFQASHQVAEQVLTNGLRHEAGYTPEYKVEPIEPTELVDRIEPVKKMNDSGVKNPFDE